jgi:murein DD-endopeptidase MepM/ murein hydrolase activator NlpD
MSQPARRILMAMTVFLVVLVVPTTHRAMAAAAAAKQVAPTVEVTIETVKVVEQVAQVKVTVVRGDTLSGIHSRVCGNGNWQATWKENPFIANPNLIYPGQVLTLSCSAAAPQAPAAEPAQASSGWVLPVTACNISGFGMRWGRMHEGVDLAAGFGTPIRAASSGTVSTAWQAGGAGNYTMINHGGGIWTVYMHQSSFAVRSGWVNAGQVIGYVGQTGDAQGPHLHFETHTGGLWNGKVDPVGFMAARGVHIC